MSAHPNFDESSFRRKYTAPYSSKNPVPTVQGYQEKRQDRAKHSADVNQHTHASPVTKKDAGVIDFAKGHLQHYDEETGDQSTRQQPYNSRNRNLAGSDSNNSDYEDPAPAASHGNSSEHASSDGRGGSLKDTSETIATSNDPRQKRKNMKVLKRDNESREVTDPVTHLPVTIHDLTASELKAVSENGMPVGLASLKGYEDNPAQEAKNQQLTHSGMEDLFPPPSLEASGKHFSIILKDALTAGLSFFLAVLSLLVLLVHLYHVRRRTAGSLEQSDRWPYILVTSSVLLLIELSLGLLVVWGLRTWVERRVLAVWEDGIWDAARTREEDSSESAVPESVQWLNSLLTSVWPLINPDLFTSLADTLEDVMQASLPKLVRMISVEDLGQGNEAVRILGIKWLPIGNAKKDVSVDGQVQGGAQEKESDRKVPNEGELDGELAPCNVNKDENTQGDQGPKTNAGSSNEEQAVAEGLEAEEGDFVNVELGLSYRASSTGKSIKVKAKNAHLYLVFYLPGGIRFPVWVELRGIVATMRMRLQLCPDPPFVALCTLTLLGQPKVELSCVPLIRKGLNIMDLPLISSFVQSSIDAALAEYVAPKSLALDLKDMLVGDDFKKDTRARGVLVVAIDRAIEFKEGDAYVAIGWAKFGKPVWSTRIIKDDMEPAWNETAYILISPEELNAAERLRVQLWDSDRASADDDLGRIEIDLKQLMNDSRSSSRMWQREDGFTALSPSEAMPGKLQWSVGYFPKERIKKEQLERQSLEPDVRSLQQLKDKIAKDVGRKMREAISTNDESLEVEQQKAQDLKIREDNIIASTYPLQDSRSGILSIQIHQISGLELEKINKQDNEEDLADDTAEGEDDLPSSYCTVILNHQKIFKTRTKPKSSQPFFNAATERFIRDWRSAEVMISVRDARVHENDPLLGLIYLPLRRIFKQRSQVVDYYPIVGGIGYGRARVSLVFRSVKLHLPLNFLGWEYGTIEIAACTSSLGELPASLHELRLKLRTSISRGKMYPADATQVQIRWQGKRGQPVHLAVERRYRSCLVIEFRKNRLGLDKTPAFAVLWLQDIPDEEELTKSLPIFSSLSANLNRAESNSKCDLGEQVGSIAITIKFWRGLGRYHRRLASSNPSVHDVFEVLGTASDSQEVTNSMAENRDEDESSSSSLSSASCESEEGSGVTSGLGKDLKAALKFKSTSSNQAGDGKGKGPLKQLQDYSDHSDQLHKHHRGLMQWKVGTPALFGLDLSWIQVAYPDCMQGARTAKWMKSKMVDGKDQIANSLKHHDRNPGIETEV
ncbi:MAG: hypothetical protein Q9201_000484 [Fulgogasparrea decipioides]